MKRSLLAALLGVALCALGSVASAAPVHDGSLIEMLGSLRSQLNLNTSQQEQWDNAAALSSAARTALRSNMQERRSAVQAELAKAEPDFASLAAASDAATQQLSALHKQARDAWLALYATFTPEQKATARDAIKDRIAKIQAKIQVRRNARRGSPTT